MFDALGDDVIVEIAIYLPTITLVRFLGLSKQLWKHRTRIPRIAKFKKYMQNERYAGGGDYATEIWDLEMICLFGRQKTDCLRAALLHSISKSPFHETQVLSEEIQRSKKFPKFIFEAALHEAAYQGNLHLMQYFMDKGAEGPFAIQSAAKGGHRRAVDFLMEKQHNKLPVDWSNALIQAAQGGHTDLVLFFLEKGSSNVEAAMLAAAKEGHTNIVVVLGAIEPTCWQDTAKEAIKFKRSTVLETCLRFGMEHLRIDSLIDYARMLNLKPYEEYLTAAKRQLTTFG